MSHKMLRPFIVKVSVLGYFPHSIIMPSKIITISNCQLRIRITYYVLRNSIYTIHKYTSTYY